MKKAGILWIIIMALVLMFSGCGKSIEQQISEQLELGQKYLAEANYDEAIVAFEKVIDLDPKNTDAYLQLADLYITIGDKELASENYAVAYQNGVENEKEGMILKLLQLAEAALKENNNELANFYYELILELNSEVTEAFLGKVNLLIQEEQFDKAYEILKTKAEEAPDDTAIAEKLDEFNTGKIKDYKGRIIKDTWFKADGTLKDYMVYSYNDEDNETIIRYYDANDTLTS